MASLSNEKAPRLYFPGITTWCRPQSNQNNFSPSDRRNIFYFGRGSCDMKGEMGHALLPFAREGSGVGLGGGSL